MNAKEKLQQDLIERLGTVIVPIKLRTLAEYFSKSSRTIRNHLNELINENNAPWMLLNAEVMRDPTKQGKMKLKTYWFDKQELEALFALSSIIEQFPTESNFKKLISPFKNRIDEILKNNNQQNNLVQKIKLIEIAGRKITEQVFQNISQALLENKQLQISFWNRFTDQTTSRKISAITLIKYKDNWLLDAYCHHKKELRTFSLEAIQQIQIIDQTAKQIPKKQQQTHYQASYGIYAGKDNKLATLIFNPYISRWVKDEHWHPLQTGKLLKNGSYQLTIPYNNDTELISEILKHGANVKVIAPQELKDKIIKVLENTLKVYKN